jgi:hypothetical protein
MSGNTAVNDGQWHHIAYVLDKTAGEIGYIDGVVDVSSNSATGNCGLGCSGFNWASDYWIGTGAGCRYGANSFAGTIDEVALFKSALTAAEVKTLYNLTK